jgi:peptidoglycan/LPS O-acetylase OafA/YrhL
MQKEFAFINFFRAIAAFWVLVAHCMIWGGWTGGGIPDPKLAVDLFMLISGFLMAANAGFNRQREPFTSRTNWYRFWLKRFFRIAPAYYLSLALAVIFSTYFLGGYSELQELNPSRWRDGGTYDPNRIEYSATNIMLHLTFLFGLHPQYSFSTFLPDWSLSLEMQFYLAFPLLFMLMDKFGYLRISIAVAIPCFVVGFYVNMYLGFFEPSLLLMKLNYFIAGILIFRFIELRQAGLKNNAQKIHNIIIILVIFILVSLDYLRYELDILYLWGLSFMLLISADFDRLQKTPQLFARAFKSRFVRFASDCSYSVYLFHGFFISMFGLFISENSWLASCQLGTRLILMLLFVVVTSYSFSYVIYKVVELPGIQVGKSVIGNYFRAK